MKRWMRRVVAAAVGLMMGWYCAGWVQEAAWAEHGGGEGGVQAEETAVAVEHAGSGETAGLAPGTLPGWYGRVVGGAAGLFGAAVVVGAVKKEEQAPTTQAH